MLFFFFFWLLICRFLVSTKGLCLPGAPQAVAAGGRVNGPESPQEVPEGPLAGSGGWVHPQDASPGADGTGLLVPLLLVVRVNPLRRPITTPAPGPGGRGGQGFPHALSSPKPWNAWAGTYGCPVQTRTPPPTRRPAFWPGQPPPPPALRIACGQGRPVVNSPGASLVGLR